MKYRRLFLTALAVLLLYGATAFISYTKLRVADPFAAVTGLTQILLTDKEYAEIQNDPKVIIAKPEASLDAYMEERGLEHDAEQQMGAIRVFAGGDSDSYREYVHHSVNRYFSKWSWISK